jgi:catechol-2,3-dioxygenase
MTANRRTDVLGVHSLDHFRLTVPNLGEAEAFYTAFGLDVRNTSSGFDLSAKGHPHRWESIAKARANSSIISRSARTPTRYPRLPNG